jgi:hypothetical protein
MFVVQFDAKHRAGQHHRDPAFDFYVLFIHDWHTGNWDKPKIKRRCPVPTEPRLEIPIRLIATATATATAVIAATTAAGGRAFFTRLGNAYCEGASSHILAVKGLNGLLRFLVRAHGHESKAARTIGHAIHYQVGFRDRAMRGERVSHLIFSGFQGKASDKQFIVHLIFYCPTNRCFLQPVPERRV